MPGTPGEAPGSLQGGPGSLRGCSGEASGRPGEAPGSAGEAPGSSGGHPPIGIVGNTRSSPAVSIWAASLLLGRANLIVGLASSPECIRSIDRKNITPNKRCDFPKYMWTNEVKGTKKDKKNLARVHNILYKRYGWF